jgi:murein DD-endopeptidase MepM/ murein hydrolase activator NlpD/protocatechuate 3,4-dioxygenase beta subunit
MNSQHDFYWKIGKVIFLAALVLFTLSLVQVNATANTPITSNSFKKYVDDVYGFSINVPQNWNIYSATKERVGSITQFTSFDPNIEEFDNDPFTQSQIKIDVGVFNYDKPLDIDLDDWAAPDPDVAYDMISQNYTKVAGRDALRQDFDNGVNSGLIFMIPDGVKVYFIAIMPLNVLYESDVVQILQSFEITKPYDQIQLQSARLYPETSYEESKSIQSLSGYRLPFVDEHIITTGPGCYHTHTGRSSEAIDFSMKEQTPIYTTKAGKIVYATYGWNDGFGNLMKIQHNDGHTSWYAHLDSFIKTGGEVKCEESIARSGNSGNSTGPHLHFEIRNSNNYSVWIRDLPGISWYSNDPNNPCQPAGSNDGVAVGPPLGSCTSCSAPSLTKPSDGAILEDRKVTFDWDEVSDCDFEGYKFHVCTSPDSEKDCFIDEHVKEPPYTKKVEYHDNRDLWWWVQADNASNGAEWATRGFRINLFSIFGKVTDKTGKPIADVRICADKDDGSTNDCEDTDDSGDYEIDNLAAGKYTLTPEKSGYTFEPPSLSVEVSSDHVTGQNFTGIRDRLYTISGRVTDAQNNPLPGVSITTDKDQQATTTSTGNYTITNLAAGAYTLTATKKGCTFSPETLENINVPPNAVNKNFTGICTLYSISGKVTDKATGSPIPGVSISTDKGPMTTTDNNGDYTIGNLATGTYTLTPTKTGCIFEPTHQNVNVPPDANGVDFTGTIHDKVTIHLVPSNLQLAVDQTGVTEVQVNQVANLYGLDFRLKFDPTTPVEVVDADPAEPGVQIGLGDLFNGKNYFIARNWVYTDTGVIEFVASLSGAETPISGSGAVAVVNWQGKQTGQSALTFEQTKLADPGGGPIPHQATGSVIIVDGGGTVSGTVLLQSRTDHSGTSVFLTEKACPQSANSNAASVPIPGIPNAVTDASGHFEVTPPPGRTYQCLQAFQQGYLIGQKELPKDNVGTIALPGGDVTQDDLIDIFDLAYIGSRYNSTDPTADINADGLVDVFDLVIAAGNYGKRGPVEDWK